MRHQMFDFSKVRHSLLNDDGNYFLQRELRRVIGETILKKYPTLRFRDLIPRTRNVGRWDETWSYPMLEQTGSAKIIANYADDLPAVGVKRSETAFSVKALGDSFLYSVQDFGAAQSRGMSLDADLAKAARDAIETKMNALAWFGSTADNIPGFFSNANIDSVAATANWVTSATADQILGDVNKALGERFQTTGQTDVPDTLIVDGTVYGVLTTKRLPDTNTTVAQFLLANSPWLKTIEAVPEAATAGASDTPIAFLYKRSTDVVRMEIPIDFEPMPPQERGLTLVTPCWAKFAGVAWIRPKVAKKITGVA
jgi:hypothetical protein